MKILKSLIFFFKSQLITKILKFMLQVLTSQSSFAITTSCTHKLSLRKLRAISYLPSQYTFLLSQKSLTFIYVLSVQIYLKSFSQFITQIHCSKIIRICHAKMYCTKNSLNLYPSHANTWETTLNVCQNETLSHANTP